MTETGKTFLAEASRNEELKAKLLKIDRSDMKTAIPQAIELAKGYGFELVEEDLTMDQASVEGVMDDDELNAVAGGNYDTDTPLSTITVTDPRSQRTCSSNDDGVDIIRETELKYRHSYEGTVNTEPETGNW